MRTQEHLRITGEWARGYPNDLPDAEWARLEPLIPPARPGGRPRKTDMRAAMNVPTTASPAGGRDSLSPRFSALLRSLRDAEAAHACHLALSMRGRFQSASRDSWTAFRRNRTVQASLLQSRAPCDGLPRPARDRTAVLR